FDLIILDPPSFGSHGKKSFSIQRDYKLLASDALALLTRGGRLLAVTNHRKTSAQRFMRWLEEAARDARREVASLRESPTPHDCPAWLGAALGSPTKAFWLTLR
ncbi:MAG: class I SAM-dependent methyltransferase, partial [Myxococcales bacterium]|nr:class I SAM-dependent methyltransferase [Myxococcales bacterium]